jgi:hypothetical protein
MPATTYGGLKVHLGNGWWLSLLAWPYVGGAFRVIGTSTVDRWQLVNSTDTAWPMDELVRQYEWKN